MSEELEKAKDFVNQNCAIVAVDRETKQRLGLLTFEWADSFPYGCGGFGKFPAKFLWFSYVWVAPEMRSSASQGSFANFNQKKTEPQKMQPKTHQNLLQRVAGICTIKCSNEPRRGVADSSRWTCSTETLLAGISTKRPLDSFLRCNFSINYCEERLEVRESPDSIYPKLHRQMLLPDGRQLIYFGSFRNNTASSRNLRIKTSHLRFSKVANWKTDQRTVHFSLVCKL